MFRVIGKHFFLSSLIMDNLTKHWKWLSPVEKKVLVFNLEKDMVEKEFIIAEKFLTKRALNTDVIATTFKVLWRSKS